jgi:hypothetical protein
MTAQHASHPSIGRSEKLMKNGTGRRDASARSSRQDSSVTVRRAKKKQSATDRGRCLNPPCITAQPVAAPTRRHGEPPDVPGASFPCLGAFLPLMGSDGSPREHRLQGLPGLRPCEGRTRLSRRGRFSGCTYTDCPWYRILARNLHPGSRPTVFDTLESQPHYPQGGLCVQRRPSLYLTPSAELFRQESEE